MVIANPANYLIAPQQTASGSGSAVDARAVPGLAYLHAATYAQSAVWTIQASYDATAWLNVTAFSATTTTATAQFSGYYPYLRAVPNAIYSAAGGTGSGVLFWHPIA